MEVVFKTRKLEKCYLNHAEGRRAWGIEVARKFIQRIDLFQEAETLDIIRGLPGLDCHSLKGTRKGQLAVILVGRWRLVFSLRGEDASVIRIEEVSRHYGD